MSRNHQCVVVGLLLLVLSGCIYDNSRWRIQRPTISNINSSSDPKTPVDVIIEISGANFLSSPGKVVFSTGSADYEVVPTASGWTDTSILVLVPVALPLDTTVIVTVVTSSGTSNGIELDIVSIPTFSPSNLVWNTTTAPVLPAGLRGHKAVCIPSNDTLAYLYVVGGQAKPSGSPENQSACRLLGLTVSGSTFSTDASWTTVSSLPKTRAFFALAAAHPQNSSVDVDSAYMYVIGGQETASDAPGGVQTIYRAEVNTTNGSLGFWVTERPLPAKRWGASAVVNRGILYVLGGNDETGNPTDTIYQSEIDDDGSLANFSISETSLPVPMSSFTSFAFGGNIYVIGGETIASTDPASSAGAGDSRNVYYSQLIKGKLSSFVETTKLGKTRKKHASWNSFGQVIVAEGISGGNISEDGTVNSIQASGALGSWNGLSGGAVINADVFNAAAALSPIYPDGGGPRFILIGGEDEFGVVRDTVWINTAP